MYTVAAEVYSARKVVIYLHAKFADYHFMALFLAKYNLVWSCPYTHTHQTSYTHTRTHTHKYNLGWWGDKHRKASRSHSSHISDSEWNLPLGQMAGNKRLCTATHIHTHALCACTLYLFITGFVHTLIHSLQRWINAATTASLSYFIFLLHLCIYSPNGH